jgi:tetratricopeptide (TPR) repeat protein
MKKLHLLILLLLVPLEAQETAAPENGLMNLTPSQRELATLPQEQRKEFVKHYGEAMRLFQQKRIFESLDALGKAEKIFPDSEDLLNMRGLCYIEMRAFDKAGAALEKAIKVSPKSTGIRFNLAEVFFVSKQWKKSHDLFQDVLMEIPESDKPLARLTEFKILLCKKKLGQKDDALILAEKYDFQDDSPYHYYAKAVQAYEAEKLPEAEEWLARAKRIFREPGVIDPWQDTLAEYGYLKSFYGEDEPPAEK